MIKSFCCKHTELLYETGTCKKFENIKDIALRKLDMINAAYEINDLRVPPANHLEKLLSDRLGQYSIRINDKYRICFVWENGSAYEVEIVDYH